MSEIPQPGGRLTMLLPRQLLRYPKRWALLLIWVPIIGFLVLRSTFLYTHFQDLIKTHLREMDANLSNLVQVSAEHALRTFSAADQTLRFVIHQYRAGGPQLNLRTLVDDGTIDASLVTQAGIINAQGVLQQSSLDKGVLVNLSDRQVFKVHASADTGTVYISEPVLARADGKWAIQLSRRINHPDGRFAGVAFVAIAPQYFNGFYSALNLPSDSVLSLSGLDGITRARHWNEQSSFGDNISRDPFIQQIGSGVSSGMYTAHDALDGVERRFAFRKIEGYPLAISAGLAVQSMAAALEKAKQLMRLQATLAATAVLLIGVVLSVIYLQMHKALGDRKLAVANLREREDRLKFAMTAGGLSAWELNLANLADSPYEGVVRLLGYAPGQEDMANFSPQHFLTLMSRDKTGQISEAWTDLTSERSERMTLPLSLINQQGNRVWIEVLVQVTQWGPDGAPLRLSGLAHDVTRAKDTADAIQNSLNQWQIAISGTGSGIWDWDIQSQKLFLSDSVFTMLGYPAPQVSDEPEAREFQTWVHPDDLSMALDTWNKRMEFDSDGHEVELRLRCANGQFLWVSIRGAVMRHADGHSLRVSGFVSNISEQRFIREQVNDRNAQLAAMFSLSSDGFVTFDPSGCVKYSNPAFLTLTTWQQSDLIGLKESAFVASLNALCVEGSSLDRLEDYGNRGLALDKRVLIEIASHPPKVLELRIQLGHSTSISKILYLRDVTHETIVETLKTEFLSTAAHELRTPMAGILGFSEILLSRDLTKEQENEFLNIIHSSSVRMAAILDDLLDLVRIESGGALQTTPEVIDLVHVVNAALGGFQLPDGRSPPVVDLPHVSIWSDQHKSTQVLLNLLSNAYKYSAVDSVVEISFASHQPGTPEALVGVSIRDHGIGISPADLLRVEERFFRADRSGAVPGTGLGMSIVKEIMALLGGTVKIESTLGVGTLVTVLFPASTGKNINTTVEA